MKILVINGDCIQINSSANLCHLAYIRGLLDSSHEVTLISADGRDYKLDESMRIPEGVKSLEVYAFLNCSVLSSLSLPSTITYLGTYVIDNCPLEELTFRGTIAQWNAIEKEDFVSYDSPLHVVHCTDGDVNL